MARPAEYDEIILRVFKIKQARLGPKPKPDEPARLGLFEYELICDLHGPCRPRGTEFVHMSDFFKLQLRGDNLLKGLVVDSLRVIDSANPDESRHFVEVNANLMDSQILITAEFDLAEERPKIDQIQIHFKILIKGQLDINTLRHQRVNVLQHAHEFEQYHRNGTPPTTDYLTKGFNPFEEEKEEDPTVEDLQLHLQRMSIEATNRANQAQQEMENQARQAMANQANQSMANQAPPLVVPQRSQPQQVQPPIPGGSQPQQVNQPQVGPENGLLRLLDEEITLMDKPGYTGESFMIRVELIKLPAITAVVTGETKVETLIKKLTDAIWEKRLHFPEVNTAEHYLDNYRIHYQNWHITDTQQRIQEIITTDRTKIHHMQLIADDPILNAQRNHELPPFDEDPLDMREKAVRRFMEQIIILMRNCNACLDNITYKRQPTERIRFNHSENLTASQLSARDLGHVVLDMAKLTRSLGMALSQLAHVCQKDERYVKGNKHDDEKLARAKLVIQNVMDSLRYLSPAVNSLSRMVVALDSTPRLLYVLQEQRQ